MRNNGLYIILLVLLMTGCHRTAPQRPTRLGEQRADSTVIRLIALNEQLSEQADRAILDWINRQQQEWTQLDCGAWIRKPINSTQPPQEGQEQTIHLQVYSMSGALIYDCQRTVLVGREEGIPTAVSEVLREGLIGQEAQLVCPWYAGYGPHGNDQISPYENILINVQIR